MDYVLWLAVANCVGIAIVSFVGLRLAAAAARREIRRAISC